MQAFEFQLDRPLTMTMTGKFVAPSADWKHMNRVLSDYELFVPSKGTMYITNGKARYEIGEGEYLLMPPLSRQYGYTASACSFYWLHFLADPSRPPSSPPICIPAFGTLANKEKLIVMMKQLQDAVRSYSDPLMNNYLTTGIVCELYNQMNHTPSRDLPQRKQQQLYNDIVDYVKWHRFDVLQVAKIADHFGYNAKYLSQMFAKISGIPLKRFIMQQRMDAAAFLLTDTNMTISEIASQLGYTDSHHFMKSFKLLTHVTPSEYRNAASKRLLNH